jgi:uncharacterized RDD family membrane protein YckC
MTAAETAPVALNERLLGTRVVAAIIDIVILAIAGAALALATGGAESTDANDGTTYKLNLEGVWFLVWVVAALAYYTILEAVTGQTLGKRALNLRVVAEDGSRPTLGQIVGRNAMRLVDVLPAFYLVGFIAAAVDDEARRLGDRAAGTRVARPLANWEVAGLEPPSPDGGW